MAIRSRLFTFRGSLRQPCYAIFANRAKTRWLIVFIVRTTFPRIRVQFIVAYRAAARKNTFFSQENARRAACSFRFQFGKKEKST